MPESTSTRERNCSTDKDMTALTKGSKRICLPIHQDQYTRIVADPTAFRQCLDGMIAQYPELFPAAMTHGYTLDGLLPASRKMPDIRLPGPGGRFRGVERERVHGCSLLCLALQDRLHR